MSLAGKLHGNDLITEELFCFQVRIAEGVIFHFITFQDTELYSLLFVKYVKVADSGQN